MTLTTAPTSFARPLEAIPRSPPPLRCTDNDDRNRLAAHQPFPMVLPTLHLKDIPEEGLTLDVALDEGWLRGALEDSGYSPVPGARASAHLRLDKQGTDVIVSGRVEASLSAQCGNCLAQTALPVHTEFTLNLQPSSQAPKSRHKGEEIELTVGELDVDYYENDKIDLGHWVREQLLVEAPTHPRCPEGCAEPIQAPPPAPRVEHTIDPRLAPLMKFKKE